MRRRACLLGAGLLPIGARASSTLRVVGSADPPFREFHHGRPGGLYFDLLQEAAARAHWPVAVREVPAARALLMLEQGEADAMLGPLRTPERERYLHYSRVTLPPEDKVFYTRPGSLLLRQFDDLPGLRIGVQRGKRYGKVFDEDERLQRIEVSEYRAAMAMVGLGRLDVAVAPERQGDRLLQQLGLRLAKQPLRIPGELPYLVLARRSSWLARLPELEQAFDSMRRDGVWARIESRY